MTIAVGYQPHLGNSPNNSSFYLALRVLPAAKREAMYSVYAFCRAVDDVADSDTDPERRLTVLTRWRAEIDHLYGRERHSRLETLRNAIVHFGLERRDFLAIIDGMEMDVRGELWAPDWPQLELYCDRVASAVGRLSVRIFGLDDDHGLPLAHHLGRALQLTNILRDLDEDASLGRLYLPREALEAASIRSPYADALDHPCLDDACQLVAQRALHHFEAADAVMERCPRSLVRTPLIMATVYRSILAQLLARGWQPPRTRISTSRVRAIAAVLRYGLF